MVFTFCAHILNLYDLSFDGKLYVFPIESAFKYSHQLNRKNNYSVAFSENHDSVAFSEKQEIDDVIPQGLSRGNESSNCLSGNAIII